MSGDPTKKLFKIHWLIAAFIIFFVLNTFFDFSFMEKYTRANTHQPYVLGTEESTKTKTKIPKVDRVHFDLTALNVDSFLIR